MNPSKNSLAYDLQEPFRFLVDLAVINLIETERMDAKDFIRTESYSLRLKLSGAKKVTEEFQSWMNQKIPYQINSVTWSYSLLLKTRKSAQYLIGKRKTLDFSRPKFTIERQDSEEIRKKILSISYTAGRTWDSLRVHYTT
jgi:CRISPR-associated protein Cas1